jgi:predicted O-methyltransferase YrrM
MVTRELARLGLERLVIHRGCSVPFDSVRSRALILSWALGSMASTGCQRSEDAPSPAAEPESIPAAEPASTPAAEPPSAPAPAPHFITSEEVDTTVDGKGEGPYRFTARWHTSVMKTWTEQLAGYRGKPDLRYLEIGVFEGRSLLWMFENVLTDPSSRATVIDVFMADYESTYDANVLASGAGDRITKLEGPSQQRLRPLEPASFDIIYIDGSHTADDVLADAVLGWPLLREGGVMIFDDYRWTGRPAGGSLPIELLPTLAIDAFITAHRNEIELRHRDYQVFLRRKVNPCVPKDYCSPIGQYTYFWRAFELRRADGTPVELSKEERELVELIARSKKIGDVGFTLDPRFVAAPAYVALATRLELEL